MRNEMPKESPDNKEPREKPARGITRRDFLKIGGGAALAALAGIEARANEQEYEEGTVFDPEVQRKTLERVAEIMKVVLKPSIKPPKVIRAERISDEDFNKMVGVNTEGKRINVFIPPNTIILISSNDEIHNLAHELAHYIQYNYNDRGVTDDPTDRIEETAVTVQNYFR